MAKPHDNPAALRALLLQSKREIDKLNGQLKNVAEQMLTLQSADQKLNLQNRQLMGFLCALVYEAGGELALKLSTIDRIPETAGIVPDVRPEHDRVVLRYTANAAAEQAALESRAADAAAAPPEPDPQTTCANGWHYEANAPGVRCGECGGRGKVEEVIQ